MAPPPVDQAVDQVKTVSTLLGKAIPLALSCLDDVLLVGTSRLGFHLPGMEDLSLLLLVFTGLYWVWAWSRRRVRSQA